MVINPTILTWFSMGLRALLVFGLLFYAGTELVAEQAAVFMICLTLTGLVGIFEFGFAATFTRFAAYTWGNENSRNEIQISGYDFSKVDISSVLRAIDWIYLRLTIAFIVIFALAGTLALIGPISALKNTDEGWISWFCTFIGALFLFSQIRHASLLIGCNEIPRLKIIELIVNIPLVTALCGLYLLDADFFIVLMVFNSGFIILFFLTRLGLRQILTSEDLSLSGEVDYSFVKIIFNSAWRSGLGVLLTSGTISGSALLVSQYSEPDIAASYLILQRIAIHISSYSYVPFQVKIPQMASNYTADGADEILKIAGRAVNQVLLLAVTLGMFFFLIIYFVLPMYGLKPFPVSGEVWLFMVAYIILERSGAMNLQLHTLCNKVKWHIANGISGGLMLALSPILYYFYGISGVPMAFLLAYLLFYFPYTSLLVKKEFPAFRTPFKAVFFLLFVIGCMGQTYIYSLS